MIRQPFLHQSTISQQMKLKAAFSGPSCMLLSPLQASALKSAYSLFVNQENNNNDNHSDDLDDLEELSFESTKPLMMKRKVRLDYVSDYEWDEDNESLEDYEDVDDAWSVDSEITLPVSNKAYCYGKLSPSSSATSSTATIGSDCSISSVASFDSEVAVSKHHHPIPIYHHHHNHRHSTPHFALSSAPSSTTKKEKRNSFSTLQCASANKSNGTTAKKPFVRPDLMPSPLSSQSLVLSPPCPPSPRRRRKSHIGQRRLLFRTSSCRSAVSAKSI